MPSSFTLTDQEQLDAFCAAAADTPFVAVDTEFLREKTYWPKLCLVQMAIPGKAVLLDPIATDLDWQTFYDLMQNSNCVKVFHSGRQDLEIFWKLTGVLPTPVFDTQIAAMVCGYGDSIGYDRLVQAVLNVRIDKNSQFTDWSRRPLLDKQLRYAIGDVVHLAEMYPILQNRIAETGRNEWIKSDMQALLDPALYRADPETIWRRMKFKSNSRRQHAAFRRLTAWREMEAQARDLPRGFVIRDESLQEIAAHMPDNEAELKSIRGLPGGFADGVFGQKILHIIRDVQALPNTDLPELDKDKQNNRPSYASALDLLKTLLRHASEKHNVASKLLATMDDLEVLACREKEDVPCLHGWRYDLFGKDAVALMDGKIALTLQKGDVELIDIDL